MCCRYYIEEKKELEELFENVKSSRLTQRMVEVYGRPFKTSGESFPTDIVPAIAPDREGKKSVFPMTFGFTQERGGKPLLNARAETAGVKPTFRKAWTRNRCIVPASYYFEWEHFLSPTGAKKTGDKYMIQPDGHTFTWLCGLYRIENGMPQFVILTKEPADNLRWLHDRMPVMLPEEMIENWVRPESDPAGLMEHVLTDMVWEKA